MRDLVRRALLCIAVLVCASQAFAQCGTIPIVSPADGSTGVQPNDSGTVLLEWTAVSGATSYDVFFGDAQSGCTTVRATVTGPQWSPPASDIQPNTTYAWRVQANGTGCGGAPSSDCASFTTANACPNSIPTLTAPANGSVQPFGSITLSWTEVANASEYELWLGLNDDVPTMVGTVTGTSTIVNMEPGYELTWYVVATAADCSGMASSPSTFSTNCPQGVPELVGPATGTTVPPGSEVTFDWSPFDGAAGYDLEINDGNGWVAVGQNLTATQFTTTLQQGEYDWAVRANFNGSCAPAYSETRELIVGSTCPASTPAELLAPDANATVTPPVRFDWSDVQGSEGYTLLVQKSEEHLPRVLTTTNNSEYETTELESGTYEWWVITEFPNCPSAESAHRIVTVQSNCPEAKATLVAPAPGAVNVQNPVAFQWNAVADARGYRVFASSDGGTPQLVATTTETTATATLTGSQIMWTVQTLFDNDCATIADPSHFTLAGGSTGCPANPGKATLVSPPNGATNLASPVTFSWNAVPGAVGYRVLASFNSGEPSAVGFTTATSLSASVPVGSGYWLVQTLFGENCATTFSERRLLTVSQGDVCNAAPPQLLAPANGASNVQAPVTFAWNAVPGAVSYRLFVAVDGSDFSFYGESDTTSMTRNVPAGTIRWLVTALFATCPEVRSSVFSFTVASGPVCPEATIVLTAPANDATVTSPVQVTWSAVANAVAYRVWISNGGAPVNVARTTETSAVLNLPSGPVTWYVEALRNGCDPVVSPRGRFTVTPGTNCAVNAAPMLVAPLGTSQNPGRATSPVTLTWAAAPNAIGYRVWVGRNGTAFEDVKLTRETTAIVPLDPGLYSWFVQALYEGCDPKPSERAFFVVEPTSPRCPTGTPNAISPAQGSTSTSPVTFVWSAVERAKRYRLFVSVDGGQPALLGTTGATELTRPLPPGTISWSVEAVFEECPSTFSPRTQFSVPQSQNCPESGPDLVSPPDASTVGALPVDFTWTPVSGAVKYVVVVKLNDGAPTPIGSTSDIHLLRETMAPGKYEWWVVTFFSGCDPVESEHATFTLQSPQGCDDRRKPILLIPRDEVPSPVHFQWTAVPRATGYQVWLSEEEGQPSIVASTTEPRAEVELPEGTYEWFVQATFANCPPSESARGEFRVTAPVPCGTPTKPEAQVIGQALSGTEYNVRWTPLANVNLYEVQESTSADFANAQTFTTSDASMKFSHEVSGNPVQYFYRVRGVSDCNDERGAYSDAVAVFIVAPKTNNASTELGFAGNVVQTVVLPADGTRRSFTATTDKPWLTVTPANGTIHEADVTLTVTADPGALPLGTNTGTVIVQYDTATASGPRGEATTSVTMPVSVSLVTPVLPAGKGTPPPDSLIFPIVGHAQGANNSLFESDIRVTNLTAQTQKYTINFTPSGVDGTQSGSSSTIEIASNVTMALDDVVASMFGSGTISSATGMLEVRPLTTSSSSTSGSLFTSIAASAIKQLNTAASSRTYNFTPNGTFGQFIPATRFSDFVGKALQGAAPQILSLQQVAQSSAYRANFGFAEASGQPADVVVRVYDAAGQLLATIPVALQAGEHKQLNGMLANNGITNLADGRVEVEVTNGNGKITAYVSEVDNFTNDPLLVSPVLKGTVASNRYVVPGTAYIDSGFVFWVTDLRVFNAGTTSTPATLTFYPQGNPSAAVSRDITINAGEIKVLDNVVGDLFAQPNGAGGMIAISTPENTTLTATARTYNKTANGTYGQYIPGVTPAEAVGASDRALQLLQLEQSSRFRTNIGLAETSGNAATIEVSAIVPDSVATPVVTLTLQANEFRQISLADFGLSNAYNVRATVKVIGGTGRVTAYGSAIDQITQDPTYVPAQ